jgi:nucleoid DNA-binding protein
MATKIKYGIHRNPLPNEQGDFTYQVRLEPSGTFKLDDFILKLKANDKTLARQAERIITLLKQELTNQLQDNMRFRLNGIGTFQLKVGFKHQEGGRGRIGKTHFTNPEAITADAVEVTGLSFIPDPSFIRLLKRDMTVECVMEAGTVGHSAIHSEQEVIDFLTQYIQTNGYITRQTFTTEMGLTKYMGQKWLDDLADDPQSPITRQKEGRSFIYSLKE